jgi:hypothetical protein
MAKAQKPDKVAKEVAYIYCWNFIILFFIVEINFEK